MSSDEISSGEDELEALHAVCEVCGMDCARAVMQLCSNYGPDHEVGCHTYCMVSPLQQGVRKQDIYTCLACSDHETRVKHAVGKARADRRLKVLKEQGKADELEEMPELQPIEAQVHVRRASEIRLQPTHEMRTKAALAAAGQQAAAQAAGNPAKQPKAAALAATGPGPSGKGGKAAGPLKPPEHADLHLQQHKRRAPGTRSRGAARQFVKNLNKGYAAGVNAAKARAQKAAAGAAPAADKPAATGAAGRKHKEQQKGPDAVQQLRNVGGYTIEVVPVNINCQLVRSGDQQSSDLDEGYLVVRGTMSRSLQEEAHAAPSQQRVYEEMLADMTDMEEGQAVQELTGGVFDIARHRGVTRYADNAAKSYRPLKFIPAAQAGKNMVKELLVDKQRFVALSLGQKLLVMLPTPSGELLGLCPRDADDTDDLLKEVVESVMKDPNIGKEMREDLELEAPHVSESLEGVPAAAGDGDVAMEDDKEALQELLPTSQPQSHTSGGPAAEAGAAEAGAADSPGHQQPGQADEPQQRQEQQEQQTQATDELEGRSAVAGARRPVQLPVRHLPAGMLMAQQQQHQMPGGVTNGVASGLVPQRVARPLTPLLRYDPGLDVAAAAADRAAKRLRHDSWVAPEEPRAGTAAGGGTGALAHGFNSPIAQRVGALLATQAAAGAAAGEVTGGLTRGSCMPFPEAVESSTLALLLKQLQPYVRQEQGQQLQQQVNGQQRQQRLSMHNLFPQMHDLAEVQQLRLFLVGFPPDWLQEGTYFATCIDSARKLGAEVHDTPSALQELIKDVGLHEAAATHNTRPLGSPLQTGHTAGTAAPAAPGSPTGNADVEMVDLTELPDGSCCRLLLLPEHMSNRELQEALELLPLWRLLASSVAVYRQGPGQAGMLHWLHMQYRARQLLRKQQKQQQQLQTKKAAAQTADPSVQEAEGRMRLSAVLGLFQAYRNGLAVVATCTGLDCSTKQQVQQLVELLQQAAELQEAEQQQQQRQQQQVNEQQGHVQVAVAGEWCLVLSRQHMQSLKSSRQQLLEPGVASGSVLHLEDLMVPGTVDDEGPEAEAVVVNAARLAQQRQQLRLVLVVVPDICAHPDPQQQQQKVGSAPGSPASYGLAGAGRDKGGTSRSSGSSSSGGQMGQGATGATTPLLSNTVQRVNPTLKRTAQQMLLTGCEESSVLTGTMSQVLHFLECLVRNSRGSRGFAAGQQQGGSQQEAS